MKYLKLYENVKHNFEYWSEVFSEAELYLDCGGNGFTNLKGIEKFTKLEYLNTNYNQLTNLKDIASLTNLKKLIVSNNQLISLEGIENLKNLEYLDCRGNELTSLDGIENCKNLNSLYCQHNKLNDLYIIEKLPNLKKLFANPNPWKCPIPYNIYIKFGLVYPDIKLLEIMGYKFQKAFLEEHPERIRDLKYIGFQHEIKEEYKDLLDFFNIKI